MDYEKIKEFTYELKCRRCGKYTEYFQCKVGEFSDADIQTWRNMHMQYPKIEHCVNCGGETVQDVVMYRTVDEADPITPKKRIPTIKKMGNVLFWIFTVAIFLLLLIAAFCDAVQTIKKN